MPYSMSATRNQNRGMNLKIIAAPQAKGVSSITFVFPTSLGLQQLTLLHRPNNLHSRTRGPHHRSSHHLSSRAPRTILSLSHPQARSGGIPTMSPPPCRFEAFPPSIPTGFPDHGDSARLRRSPCLRRPRPRFRFHLRHIPPVHLFAQLDKPAPQIRIHGVIPVLLVAQPAFGDLHLLPCRPHRRLFRHHLLRRRLVERHLPYVPRRRLQPVQQQPRHPVRDLSVHQRPRYLHQPHLHAVPVLIRRQPQGQQLGVGHALVRKTQVARLHARRAALHPVGFDVQAARGLVRPLQVLPQLLVE